MIQSRASRIKNWLLIGIFALFITSTGFVGLDGASAAPATTPAPTATPSTTTTTTATPAGTGTTCDKAVGFLTFPVWYRGLNKSAADCDLVSPDAVGGIGNFIWRIVLNVVDIALQLVGYIAAGFILYGGFLFLTSAGDPGKTAKARTMILDAAIGLAISIGSVAIINIFAGVVK